MKRLAETVLLVLLLNGCDDSVKPSNIQPKLHHVAYWGLVRTGTSELNAGDKINRSITLPVWTSQSSVVVSSGRVLDRVGKTGLFLLNLDNYGLVDYEFTEFADPILDLSYSEGLGEVLIVTASDQSQRIVGVELGGDNGEPVVLVNEQWFPLGVVATTAEEFVFYGMDPETETWGFFRGNSSGTFELIHDTLISVLDARGFDVNDNTLVFPRQTDFSRSEFLVFDLQTGKEATILEVDGVGGSASMNPHEPSLLLLSYFRPGIGEGIILLHDAENQETRTLDVRTDPRRGFWPTSAEPRWNPNGSDFIFTSGARSGEGDFTGQTLWAYRDAP